MQTSLYSITIPLFIKNLNTLSKILDKAVEEKGAEADSLLASQLAPDQFAFARQVQATCDQAKFLSFRLNGTEPPSFEDTETSMGELKERIQKTIAVLESVKPEDVDGHEDTPVSLKYFEGKHLSGFAYATEYILPNFFFHMVTAYSILRHEGITVGKTDFIGGLPLEDPS